MGTIRRHGPAGNIQRPARDENRRVRPIKIGIITVRRTGLFNGRIRQRHRPGGHQNRVLRVVHTLVGLPICR